MPPRQHVDVEPSSSRLIAATRKVNKHLRVPASDGARTPILNFTEELGFGNTAVLDHLAKELDGKAPFAMVDCERYSEANTPRLLVEIKRQLAHGCESYPTFQFRRFELGSAVIKEAIPFDIQREARRKLKRAAGQTFAPAMPDESASKGLIEFLLLLAPRFAWIGALALSLFQSRFPELYDFYKWYGHRDQQIRTSPLHLMENLNGWAFPGDEVSSLARAADFRRRDEVLIEALLADLRGVYRHGRLARDEWHNSVVLLRNADARTGRALLKRLRDVRTHLDRNAVRAEPLLIVAGSERRLDDCLSDERAEDGEPA
ncbi:hypothetical protein GCM10027447_22510 [Glycomyces halotolerans]